VKIGRVAQGLLEIAEVRRGGRRREQELIPTAKVQGSGELLSSVGNGGQWESRRKFTPDGVGQYPAQASERKLLTRCDVGQRRS